MMNGLNTEVEIPYLLYADDDPDDLLLLKQMLSNRDHQITLHECFSGRRAIDFLDSLEAGKAFPHLIILDLNMPDWDGMYTLEKLKAHPLYSGIPVVIFTNSNHPRHKTTALAMGADKFLTKPYGKEEAVRISDTLAEYTAVPPQVKQ